MPIQTWNTLGLAHAFLEEFVPPGGFVIDATAGRGRDTAFLCRLVGEKGRVLAFDIQQEAVDSTLALLKQEELLSQAQVVCDSHAHMDRYASPETVDAVVFNLGYLPGGSHKIQTQAASTQEAVIQGLKLLRPGGVMVVCIYYGGDSGFEEKDAMLEFFQTLDSKRYTVLVTEFANRPNCPPIPVFIRKE